MESEFELIAKTFQGLEDVLAKELTELGANDIRAGHRMVSFTGDKELMYRANFALRTAIRVLKPVKHFKAQSADEVYDAVKAIDWTPYLGNGASFAVDSVVFSKDFRHSKFVAYKVKDAIADFFREKTGSRPNVSVTNPDLQLNIHIAEDDCTLSLDSSGESLHRRGYRQATVEAPLNEVLAAGMILLTGWNGECDLIDPMCGSGTIAIEAALIARGIAPGVFRKGYAFEKWPDFDKELLGRIYNDESGEREFNHKIYGYDINRNAADIAVRNVKAAGLGKEIEIARKDFREFTQPAEKSVIVTNPPYGERVAVTDLLGLYRMIGERLKHQFQDNEAWILSYREEFFDQIGLKPSVKIPLYNGSLECEFRKFQIFSGKYKEMRAGGGIIKTDEERRQMAENRRFKAHREFKRPVDDEEEYFSPGKRDYYDRDGRQRGGRPFDRRQREYREDRDNPYGRRPFGREWRSFDREERPSGSRNKPSDREWYPGDREWKPFDRGGRSFGREWKPFDRGGRSFDRERKPFDRDGRSFDRERKPFDRDEKPFDRERKPFGRGEKPFGRGEEPFAKKRRYDRYEGED